MTNIPRTYGERCAALMDAMDRGAAAAHAGHSTPRTNFCARCGKLSAIDPNVPIQECDETRVPMGRGQPKLTVPTGLCAGCSRFEQEERAQAISRGLLSGQIKRDPRLPER